LNVSMSKYPCIEQGEKGCNHFTNER
jgi:hypothetical protein